MRMSVNEYFRKRGSAFVYVGIAIIAFLLLVMFGGIHRRAKEKARREVRWEFQDNAKWGYSVTMPGAVESKTTDIPGAGVKITMNIASSKIDTTEFVMAALKFPGALDGSKIDTILDGCKKNLMTDPGDRFDSERKISLGIHPGREYTMTLGKRQSYKLWAKVYVNLNGGRIIISSVQFKADDPDTEANSKFMDSLKIL